MASELDYRYEGLQRNVDLLLGMHHDVTELRSRVSARLGDATPGSWPDVAAVRSFAGRYYSASTRVEARLTQIEQDLESARSALAESIRAMQNVDEAQREWMERLAAQVDVVADVPAPQASVPPGTIS